MLKPQIEYIADFLPAVEADRLFLALREQVIWERHTVRLFGREVDCPRLSAWYGDGGATYAYSGSTHVPRPWIPELEGLRCLAENAVDAPFNSVLLNRYRDGQDSMGWHADDEPELGPDPVIASVSLGARRKMRFRLKADHTQTAEVWLDHGSLLVMRGSTQRDWQHNLPKTRTVEGERLNLTFRQIR